MKIKRALLSVSNKTGLVVFAQGLLNLGVELISTGGTADVIRAANLDVFDVSDFVGFPSIFGGRVKTLHPKIHGGLLFKRDNPVHQEESLQHNILPIELLCVNLYPFEETITNKNVTLEEAIEQIDIGGPAMIRSAAKNYNDVAVIVDPNDYPRILQALQQHDMMLSVEFRKWLSTKAFALTSNYDRAISSYLNTENVHRKEIQINLPLCSHLRYGENPHQSAELYGNFFDYFEKLHGKDLSYNNILDISSAYNLISEFSKPTVAVFKHTNPCGVGTDENIVLAWEKAFSTDKIAPFGGVIVVNRPIDESFAHAISEIFSEVIIAPEWTAGARLLLQKKKNLRLIRSLKKIPTTDRDIRSVIGGILVQDADSFGDSILASLENHIVSQRYPTQIELESMKFGWKIVKHIKSNAIIYVSSDRTLSIGAGQMSRVDSARLAVWKAQQSGISLIGSILCSEAFFPFPDGVTVAADAGAVGIIQTGGSIKDSEIIEEANKRNITMVFTGKRHFKH